MMSGCATLHPVHEELQKPGTKTQVITMPVRFVGTSPTEAELFVCGFVEVQDQLSCVDWVLHQNNMNRIEQP